MTPFIWLTLWLVAAVVLLILGAIGAYPVGYRRGYAAAMREEPRHRKGDPVETTLLLPRAGRLPLDRLADPAPLPGEAPLFLFTGEPTRGWGAESAEYELLTQTEDRGHFTGVGANTTWHPAETAEQPVSVTGEPPIDTGELLAITDRVEAWIAGWAAQGNYDRHTMRAD